MSSTHYFKRRREIECLFSSRSPPTLSRHRAPHAPARQRVMSEYSAEATHHTVLFRWRMLFRWQEMWPHRETSYSRLSASAISSGPLWLLYFHFFSRFLDFTRSIFSISVFCHPKEACSIIKWVVFHEYNGEISINKSEVIKGNGSVSPYKQKTVAVRCWNLLIRSATEGSIHL